MEEKSVSTFHISSMYFLPLFNSFGFFFLKKKNKQQKTHTKLLSPHLFNKWSLKPRLKASL